MFRITLERLPLRVDFEAGSVAEAVAILQEQDTALRQIVSLADDMAGNTEQPATGEADKGDGAGPTKGKPGRKPKDKSQPDPSTATAPPPVAVPPAAPTLAPAADDGIPPFLQRTAEAPAAAAPPPPPAPPAPPVVPPSGILAGKVIANLDQRKAGTPDGGKSLADWLAQCGLVNPGESYDAAIAVVRMTTDDKLAAIAGQLGVS